MKSTYTYKMIYVLRIFEYLPVHFQLTLVWVFAIHDCKKKKKDTVQFYSPVFKETGLHP